MVTQLSVIRIGYGGYLGSPRTNARKEMALHCARYDRDPQGAQLLVDCADRAATSLQTRVPVMCSYLNAAPPVADPLLRTEMSGAATEDVCT